MNDKERINKRNSRFCIHTGHNQISSPYSHTHKRKKVLLCLLHLFDSFNFHLHAVVAFVAAVALARLMTTMFRPHSEYIDARARKRERALTRLEHTKKYVYFRYFTENYKYIFTRANAFSYFCTVHFIFRFLFVVHMCLISCFSGISCSFCCCCRSLEFSKPASCCRTARQAKQKFGAKNRAPIIQ